MPDCISAYAVTLKWLSVAAVTVASAIALAIVRTKLAVLLLAGRPGITSAPARGDSITPAANSDSVIKRTKPQSLTVTRSGGLVQK